MVKIQTALVAAAALTCSVALAQIPTPAKPIAPAPIEPPVTIPAASTAPAIPQQIVPPAPIEPAATGAIDPATGTAAPLDPAGGALPSSRLNDFQGDPIDLVLRTLARQARMNVVVSDKVTQAAGTVNMRIEDKSPKEAIEIIVESKGLVMDEGKGGVYYIKTVEEKAKEPTESGNYTFSFAQAEKVLPLLQSQLQSGVAPQYDQRTNTVFYRENRSNLEKVSEFLKSIDRPTQQVMIEARLVEVTANPKQSYGINWAGVVGGSANAQTIRYGGSGPNGLGAPIANVPFNSAPGIDVTDGPLNAIIIDQASRTLQPFDNILNGSPGGGFLDRIAGQYAILSVPQMALTMRLLNEDADAEFLAHPRVVTSNNQKAEIKITRNQPVPQLNFNEQTAQAVFSGFQDKEFGNTLVVTPSINKDDFVTLQVKPEISNKVGDATFAFGGAVVTSPVIDKRTLESNVLIRSGDTLAIGGLLQDEQTKGRTKVPVVGDIPILGYLFQERINQRTKRNLLVFVTPTVIKEGYGTGLESQTSGLAHSGDEYADPNGWRNNAKGARRILPTSQRQLAADYPKPGIAPAPKKVGYKVSAQQR
jgi:type IV pilus assembly protein PilQ